MQRRRLIAKGLEGALALAAFPMLHTAARAAELVRGRPARAILVTGGPFLRYRSILLGVAAGLKALELIERAPAIETQHAASVPEGAPRQSEPRSDPSKTGTADVWAELAKSAGGSRLAFLADGHYDYGFSEAGREAARTAVLERLKTKRDVDIVFVFGTEATLDMAAAVKDIPVVSLGSSDPVRTGIVKSADDSGQDNLHAVVVADYYGWQTRSFGHVYPFKRLGLPIASARNEKSGEPEIRKACEELGAGFILRTYEETGDAQVDDAALLASVEALANEGADAIMFPWFSASPEMFRALLTLLERRGIASFSQAGPDFVERGILLGVGSETFEGYGFFEAEVILRILEGDKPRQIGQRYAQRGRLVVNLRSAMALGWQPPFGLLVAAEKAWTTQSPVALETLESIGR